ncbi:SDR family NAD(P)-dependent oxidoreductase [Streptomyces yangpuensis]
MALEHHRVVITAAGRDFGRTLALRFASRGAEAHLSARADHIDVLVNNGSRYQHGTDLLSASDEDVIDPLASGATGTVLATKAFLPLLLQSAKPDIVTVVSGCGETGHHRSDAHDAHDAFYAAKSAQAGPGGRAPRRPGRHPGRRPFAPVVWNGGHADRQEAAGTGHSHTDGGARDSGGRRPDRC